MAEAIEILEPSYLPNVIAKNLVEEKIAILEAARVDRNERYSSAEKAINGEQQLIGNRDARDKHLGLSYESRFIINYFKCHIACLPKTFYELFCLILITGLVDI